MAHLISVCIDTVKIREAVNDLVTKSFDKGNSSEQIFFNSHYPQDYSILSLNRPDYNFFENAGWLKAYTNSLSHNYLPEKIKDFREGLGTELNDGYVNYNGYIISSLPEDAGHIKMYVKSGFFKEYIHCYNTPFTAADGREYVFILPIRSSIARLTYDITHISRNE